MRSAYVPIGLRQVAGEIRIEHPATSEVLNYEPDQSFLKEVRMWAELPETEVKKTSYGIPKRKIRFLAKYIAKNNLQLSLHNLTQIVYYRADSDIVKLLFLLWQDSYTNFDLSYLLYRLVRDTDYAGKRLCNESKVTKEILLRWFSSKDIPYDVGKSCIQLNNMQKCTLLDCLISCHISSSSTLGRTCIANFLTFCGRDEYLAFSDEALLREIKVLSDSMVVLFLKNFLIELEVEDFQVYYKCGFFLETQYTGRVGSGKYCGFFAGFPDELKQKYQKWMTYIVIRESFGDYDERLAFWNRYVPYSQKAYQVDYSQSLVIEFAAYCIIEFTVSTMGPIYIYKKEDFYTAIRPLLRKSTNQELRHELYHDFAYLFVARIVHRGDWRSETAYYLKARKIL